MSDKSKTTKTRKASQAKSEVALQRVRVNGKFVAADPDKAELKKLKLDELDEVKQELEARTNDIISEEDRAAFGSDSKKFFEWALTHAATRYEAAKYAKELISRQYPSLQSIQSKQEVEVTAKVFRWEWGPELLEAAVEPSLMLEEASKDVKNNEETSEEA